MNNSCNGSASRREPVCYPQNGNGAKEASSNTASLLIKRKHRANEEGPEPAKSPENPVPPSDIQTEAAGAAAAKRRHAKQHFKENSNA